MINAGYIIFVKQKAGPVLLSMVCVLFYACKESYVPTVKDVNVNYLVVEGLITIGADSTIFSLSRNFKLNNRAVVAAEKGAIVQVESNDGAAYLLPELTKAGTYGHPSLNLDATKKYRLRIITAEKREYLSEFVDSKTSQPMDVRYDFKNDDLNIYANTQDASGKSKYYRYSYVETWAYEAALNSTLKIENQQIVQRNADEYTFRCWQIIPAGEIVLGSTDKLTKDLLDKRIISLSNASAKLDIEYSVLIKQTVLTREGFDFWETMRNNTERVGGIFDAQPSQLLGNIKSTSNPSEIVIGFVSAGTVSEKRLTFKLADLPTYWNVPRQEDTTCTRASIRFFSVGQELNNYLTGINRINFTPINAITVGGAPTPVAYKITLELPCADCRMYGGTVKMPLYLK